MGIYQAILCMIYFWSIVQCHKMVRKIISSADQLSQIPRVCSRDLSQYQADCRGLHLRHIPEDLSNLTEILLLSNNLIEQLFDKSFIHVPQIRVLNVSSNRIVHIDNNTFSSLRYLFKLDLSDNPIGAKSLGEAFCNFSSFLSLYMRKINFHDIKTDSFHCLQNTVSSIDVSDSYNLCRIVNGTFSNFSKLRSVRLSNSGCQRFSALMLENDSKMEYLGLNENSILDFPSFERNGKSVLVNILRIDLSNNRISMLLPQVFLGLNSLKILELSNNYIDSLKANSLFEFKSLETVILNNNPISYIEEKGLRSETLNNLDIRNNGIHINGSGKMTFKYTTAVERISMAGIKFIQIEFEEMFQNISTLKKLYLQDAIGLYHIPHYSFRGLYNLRHLTLSNSRIQEIHWFQFKDLISLTTLNLRSNQITTIGISSLPRYVLHNLTYLNIENNPFHCTCSLFWFTDWVQSNIHKLGRFPNFKIYCALPEYKPLLDMNLTAAICLNRPVTKLNQVVWALVSVITLVMILFSCLQRFRWHIRYRMFNLSLWMKRPQNYPVMECNRDYIFDVFVSYNSEDSAWVMNVLVPELEVNSEPPFKLCLFERDWMPGNDIVTLIGQSIEESRKTLIILTNAFAQSEWCQLELTMAQQHMVDDDKDNIILVVMEELLSEHITPRLQLELKQRTNLEWTGDTVGQELFWQKLKYTLHKQNSSIARVVQHRDVFF